MAATSHGTPTITSRPSPSVSMPPWNASRAPSSQIKPLSATAQTLELGEFSPSYRRQQRNREGRKRAKREKKRSALKRRSRSSTGNSPPRGGASPPEQDAGAAPEGGEPATSSTTQNPDRLHRRCCATLLGPDPSRPRLATAPRPSSPSHTVSAAARSRRLLVLPAMADEPSPSKPPGHPVPSFYCRDPSPPPSP